MATTLREIATYLQEEDLRFKEDESKNIIFTGFRTEAYRDRDGDPNLPIMIRLDEDGEFVHFIAPRCYEYKEGPHKGAVLEACLLVNYMTKMVQFEYDPSDGEVRAVIELPLEDAHLTRKQFMRCLRGLAGVVDHYHDVIQTAINSGKVVREDPSDLLREFMEFMRRRRQRSIGAAGLDLEE